MTRSSYVGFVFSLLIALMLQLIMLPEWLAAARPLWIPLMLSYWALREPRLSPLLPAFVAGICCDALFGSVLGQHALGFVLVTYLVARLRAFFVLFPLWQATLALIPAWIAYAFLMFWLDGLTKHRGDAWLRWLPVISTTLFWPLVYTLMELIRQPPEED
ncbi:MAG TPA: rod shape-determining protein MreD [Solimonas sp.]|nr:rod shape-determining protein MreD [Solimonas sp.]